MRSCIKCLMMRSASIPLQRVSDDDALSDVEDFFGAVRAMFAAVRPCVGDEATGNTC